MLKYLQRKGITFPLVSGGWGSGAAGPTHAGKFIDENASITIAAVWACTRVISETLGSLPLQFFRRGPNGSASKTNDHPLSDILRVSPNRDMTAGEFYESIGNALCLNGNFYAEITRSGRRITALTPIAPGLVTPMYDLDGNKIYKVRDGATTEPMPQDKIWQVPGFGYNGLIGYSPIGQMRQALGLSLGLEEYGARIFKQGFLAAGTLEIPTWIPDDKRDLAYSKLNEQWLGLLSAHKPFILEGGMTFNPSSISPEDAQFIMARKFQNAEVARIYRVPLHMIMEMDGATFSNIEQQAQSLITYTLMPYFGRVEQNVVKWLLSPADRTRIFARFNVDALLRADTAGRATFYTQMLQNGVLNGNEVRALENRERVDGLDEYTIQLNMTTVEQLLLNAAKARNGGNGEGQ